MFIKKHNLRRLSIVLILAFFTQAFAFLPSFANRTQQAFANGSNLITNGGFESGTMQGWSSWQPVGQPSVIGIDASDAYTGTRKLYFWS